MRWRSRRTVMFVLLTAVILTTPTAGETEGSSVVVGRFRSLSNGTTGDRSSFLQLNHLTVDPERGTLYATSVNRLYQLSPDLSVQAEVATGPQLDSPYCHASGCDSSTDDRLRPTDNVNKILVLDPDSRRLIACGSLFQGACEIYPVGNVSSAAADFIPRGIAANDETSSTFAFIGPENYNQWRRSNVLYVGTTFTHNGDYRHDVPAIASRNLYSLEIAEYSFSKQSLLRIDVKYRDHFVVKYVYGFNASDFAYFVTVQKRSYLPGEEEKGYVSRLARTCISDANYDSYTEVTLQCLGPNGEDLNLIQDAKLVPAGKNLADVLGIPAGDPVLVAVFSPSRGHSAARERRSGVCIYSLRDIQVKFNENIHMCFNGSMKYRNMGYIFGPIEDGKCPEAGSTGNILDFCSVALKISGMTAIASRAALVTSPDSGLTAVQSALVHPHTVLFLGTDSGTLKKALVLSEDRAIAYEEVTVDSGYPILPDMHLDLTQEHLYVMSTRSISKVRVETCNEYKNCSRCLEAMDPYCGWCSLEKRCTVRGGCQNATHSSPRWLSFGSGQQCIDFEQVLPDRIPIDKTAEVELTIRTLPELPSGAKYQCVFGEASPMDARVTPHGLTCPAPPPERRPTIPKGTDHALVPLSVRSSETNKDFVSRNFAFFDCSRHGTCVSCVKAQWACSWCVYENRCTHDASACPRTVVSGVNNPSHLISRGPEFCPHFSRGPGTGSGEILLPNGVRKEIRLEVENLPTPQVGHTGFQCVVEIEGAKMVLPARVTAHRFVHCENTQYSYEAETGEYSASVTVVWNRVHHVDTVAVRLYKCSILGSHRDHPDCSLCLTRQREYNCSWCGHSCSYAPTCGHPPTRECPRPRIDLIQPLSGPVEGGTLVRIEGSNLGLRREDVEGRIRVGGQPCHLVDYEVSVRITCRTSPAPGPVSAPVEVGNNAGFTQSTVRFSYREIKVEGVYPAKGPESGGTILSIVGEDLNVGSSIRAYLDGLPCTLIPGGGSSSRVTCKTAPSQGPRVIQSLTLHVDAANRTLPGNPFNYTKDPTIMEIKPLKSFASGGRLMTVHGTNLDSIQRPEMVVYMQDTPNPLNKTVCAVMSSSYMECPSPPVALDALVPLAEGEGEDERQRRGVPHRPPVFAIPFGVRVGFIMDQVASVQDLTDHFPNLRSTLLYVQDPKFYQFPSLVKLYKGDTLVIEGEKLNLAADESDVNVTIGTEACNVTSLALTQLVCTPPDHQPPGTDEIGLKTKEGLPMVVVRVGVNLRYPIGYLQYEMVKPYEFPPVAVGGMAAGGAFLILLSLAILIVYRRKSTQAEREYKRIQIQMDTLESNVRSECKQAFAELQTDMTDVTADLESSGIPILPHKAYVMKVFFPGVSDHPILNDPKMRITGPRTNYDTAMVQFEQLINNKFFLLTFVETLEAQKSFTIRDKVNVASLLMVVLMGKMEYATEVLRSLLLRLIDRTVGTKYPQLMLRRTESVVEKMLTNWMALCMYDYMKEYAGSSLFLLFKAIKHQVEKGPVDAVTHDARYSLSEEKLLREQHEYNPVTIHLVQDDPHYEKIPYQTYQSLQVVQEELDEKIQCRVLDCDTISQVKSKILDALYKNTPFSLRPSIYEVDLEWRHGRGGHLILQDEDLTTKTVNGWRRLNTLAHYGVRESAVMSLVPKQSPTFPSKPCHNCSSTYTIPRSLSPLFSNGDVETGCGGNLYHMVRPLDECHSKGDRERGPKAIPEIFLTRLLSTKGTVQKFVDDLVSTVLSVNEALPPAIKWLFDLLDDAARRHGIFDPEVVHAWKSNSLPLRFWVNFIKNPDFMFDINKTTTVDSCLSVIAQTFMDACSTTEHRLGKDSPSNKLLFAKDIPCYKRMVCKFYADVAALPQVTDQELNSAMQQLSMAHLGEFDVVSALKELYIYVSKYSDAILDELETEHHCKKLHLAHKLENVACTLQGEETSTC